MREITIICNGKELQTRAETRHKNKRVTFEVECLVNVLTSLPATVCRSRRQIIKSDRTRGATWSRRRKRRGSGRLYAVSSAMQRT